VAREEAQLRAYYERLRHDSDAEQRARRGSAAAASAHGTDAGAGAWAPPAPAGRAQPQAAAARARRRGNKHIIDASWLDDLQPAAAQHLQQQQQQWPPGDALDQSWQQPHAGWQQHEYGQQQYEHGQQYPSGQLEQGAEPHWQLQQGAPLGAETAQQLSASHGSWGAPLGGGGQYGAARSVMGDQQVAAGHAGDGTARVQAVHAGGVLGAAAEVEAMLGHMHSEQVGAHGSGSGRSMLRCGQPGSVAELLPGFS
jgi:hypothetical protein